MSEEKSDHHSLRVPAWCPQCEMPMKGAKSTSSFYSWGVCSLCFIFFIEGREDRWKDGWRPSSEAVKAYLSQVE